MCVRHACGLHRMAQAQYSSLYVHLLLRFESSHTSLDGKLLLQIISSGWPVPTKVSFPTMLHSELLLSRMQNLWCTHMGKREIPKRR